MCGVIVKDSISSLQDGLARLGWMRVTSAELSSQLVLLLPRPQTVTAADFQVEATM